ncbi:MAG: ATP-binding protein [Muribaculaceae bacterium]|nr:ATP-binding protein [Muribaculaceae bacterium]MDE6753210.1 ATP-binding protein [Muribaculaceae bacterium]
MTARIESVAIKSLFGNRDIFLDFREDVKILVGENGLGKTTILNILNEIFNGRIENLIFYPLESVKIKLSDIDTAFVFSKDVLGKFNQEKRDIFQDFNEKGVYELLDLFFSYDLNEDISYETAKKLIEHIIWENPEVERNMECYNASPGPDIAGWMVAFPSIFFFKKEVKKLGYEVGFLPTYRRIEADVNKIIPSDLKIRDNSGKEYFFGLPVTGRSIGDLIFSNELPMKFGMKDITERIDWLLKEIASESVKGYSEVSGKMIARLLDSNKESIPSTKIDPSQIKIILERLGDSISEDERSRIESAMEKRDSQDNENLIYYLAALGEVYKRTEKYDVKLKEFKKAVNAFLYDKCFRYDESHIKFDLYFNNDSSYSKPISLDKLSSGEKQLIALLATAYLADKKRVVFIIDEPELSLSLTWQRILLPSLNAAPNTAMIIAATHSPFIFDNELREFTLGGVEYATSISK